MHRETRASAALRRGLLLLLLPRTSLLPLRPQLPPPLPPLQPLLLRAHRRLERQRWCTRRSPVWRCRSGQPRLPGAATPRVRCGGGRAAIPRAPARRRTALRQGAAHPAGNMQCWLVSAFHGRCTLQTTCIILYSCSLPTHTHAERDTHTHTHTHTRTHGHTHTSQRGAGEGMLQNDIDNRPAPSGAPKVSSTCSA